MLSLESPPSSKESLCSNLAEQEVWVDQVGGEVVRARGTILGALQVPRDAGVAERVLHGQGRGGMSAAAAGKLWASNHKLVLHPHNMICSIAGTMNDTVLASRCSACRRRSKNSRHRR